jgi:AraC-like DNA-binding protein
MEGAVPPDAGTLRFSTEALPERDRLTMFREMFGRNLANMDIVPLEERCWAEIELRALPSASIMWGRNSAHRFEMLRDRARGSDELALLWAVSPISRKAKMLAHAGREATLENGMAVLTSCASPLSAVCASMPWHTTIKLDRGRLAPLLANPEEMLMRPIPPDSEALRLLKTYVSGFRSDPPQSAALQHAVVTHICDLVALAVGTTRDAAEQARDRGLRAARLHAVRRLVRDRLGDQGFSVRDAAAQQAVTPRYIQLLFEGEGTTFSLFLLGERLEFAHRLLCDPRLATCPIGAIALDAGFGDLSYFNRAFRRFYGETPSDVRQRAQRTGLH